MALTMVIGWILPAALQPSVLQHEATDVVWSKLYSHWWISDMYEPARYKTPLLE